MTLKGLYYCDWHEVYASNLALGVAAECHQVALIVRQSAPEFQGRAADADALRRDVCHAIDSFHVLAGRYWSLKSLFEIHKLLHRRRNAGFDYFHLQQTGDPRFLWLAYRLPTVLTLHEPAPREGVQQRFSVRRLISRSTQRAYRRFCDVIVVHTRSSFERLSAVEKRKAVVIPHGVKTSAVDFRPASKTILWFGRADGYKGLDVLVSAMTQVWKSEPDANLHILGSPNSGSHRYLECDTRITASWQGYSESELDSAFSSARAVCLPYSTVSGSGVAARAYGSGKPIIASDLEGLRELVRHAELLVEPGSADDLARALLEVLRHDYGVQAIDPSRTWAGVAQTHISVYESVVFECGRRPR